MIYNECYTMNAIQPMLYNQIYRRVYKKVSFTRGQYKYSLILAVGIDGIICYDIKFGSINQQLFNDWIVNELFAHLQPYPQNQSILLLDNVQFHHNDIFMEMMKDIGCIVIFLPHYDPIINLAEYVFRDVKQKEMKKNIYGEKEGLLSLTESVEELRYKKYSSTLKQIGYNVDG